MESIKYKAYRFNPRSTTAEKHAWLKDQLQRLGDLSGIIYNVRSKEFPAGNQRSQVIDFDSCPKEYIEQRDTPDDQGTLSWGYVLSQGKRLNFRIVDWDEETEKQANLVANLSAGDWDAHLLKKHFDKKELFSAGFSEEHLSQIFEASDLSSEEIDSIDKQIYTRKIKPPIYEPNGQQPALQDLYQVEKTEQLIADIKKADLPAEISDFLIAAAHRHTEFNYQQIAEYYCHATPQVQQLFEASALVVIDFKQAIEQGFVQLNDSIIEQYLEDYED